MILQKGKLDIVSTNNTKLLSVLAYETVKDKILRMEYPPGMVLTESMLSKELDISRMPVRSAMQSLQEEGWLDNSNRKKICVSKISQKDVNEVYDLRELIECASLSKIFEIKKTWEYSFKLESIVLQIRENINDQFMVEQLDLNFHTCLVTIFDNERLDKVFSNNREEIIRMGMMHTGKKEENDNIVDELMLIINAIRDNDPVVAKRLHLDHLRNGRNTTLSDLALITTNL